MTTVTDFVDSMEIQKMTTTVQQEDVASDFDKWYQYGILLNDVGLHATALQALNQAANIFPEIMHDSYDSAAFLVQLGDANAMTQNFDEALKCYEHSLDCDLNEFEPVFHSIGGRKLEQLRTFLSKPARGDYAIHRTADGVTWYLLARRYAELFNDTESVKRFSNLMPTTCEFRVNAYGGLASVYESESNYLLTIEARLEISKIDDGGIDNHNYLAAAYINAENYEASIQESRKVLSIAKEDETALKNLCIGFVLSNRHGEVPSILDLMKTKYFPDTEFIEKIEQLIVSSEQNQKADGKNEP